MEEIKKGKLLNIRKQTEAYAETHTQTRNTHTFHCVGLPCASLSIGKDGPIEAT